MDNTEKFYVDFGSHIKSTRKAKKWSQLQLAKKCDLSQSYISEIESGKAHITIDVLVKLSDAFAITPNVLLNKSEPYIDPALAVELHRMDAKSQRKLYEVCVALFK